VEIFEVRISEMTNSYSLSIITAGRGGSSHSGIVLGVDGSNIER
jgi:hypothetical protein